MGPVQACYYRLPGDAEIDAGVAALSVVIGEQEANKPSWIRRLAKSKSDGAWLVIINECMHLSPRSSEFEHPQYTPNVAVPIPTGYPIIEGVALLASEQSPEKELARRQGLIDAHNERQAAKRAEELRQEQAAAAHREQQREDNEKYHTEDWARLPPMIRMAHRLAILFEEKDPELSQKIRELAWEASPNSIIQNPVIACPKTKWFRF